MSVSSGAIQATIRPVSKKAPAVRRGFYISTFLN